MKKRCIISYACRGREDYPQGIKRLIPYAMRAGHGHSAESAFLIFSPDIDVAEVNGVSIFKNIPEIPSHQAVPYGFKPWLFKLAFAAGFDQVLWCDSTIVIHKPLDTIWGIASGAGACLFDNPGCPMRVWTSDDCMRKIGCPFDEPNQAMFNEIMACAMAFDYSNPKGKAAFDEWFSICNDGVSFAGRGGSTRPEFRAHRHDQSVMSWLAQKHSIPLITYGTLVYNSNGDRQKFPGHILANTGIYEAIR